MKRVKIGNKEYFLKIASTEEEKENGLQNIKSLPKNEGMIFIFDEPQEVSIWMKDTLIPLDIIFINDNLDIQKIYTGEPLSEKLFTEENIVLVIEVNSNSGIKESDSIDFNIDKNIKKDKMIVLDENGKSQMELSGGERIFSRANTKILIKFAKKADLTNNDNDYKTLGKRVFKFLKVQNDSEPEYVSKK